MGIKEDVSDVPHTMSVMTQFCDINRSRQYSTVI